MPRPTSATTVSRPDLAAVVYEYALEQSQSKFIGLQALPVFNVMDRSGQYPVIPLESLLKLPDTKRAPRGKYNRGDWKFELGTYDCVENGWEEPLDDVEAKMYARFFSAETVTAKRAMDVILRTQELRIKNMLFNTSNFSANNVTNEWDDYANATPLTDVNAGKKSLRNATGLDANALIIGRSVFDNLCLCAQISGAVKYTSPLELLPFDQKKALVALALGLDKILVGDAVYDSAKKGQAFSAADIWGTEYGLLCRVATDAEDLREPCLGRTFVWAEDSEVPLTMEQYREEQIRSEIYRARQHTAEKFVFTGAGYLLGNLTT